MDEAGDLFKPKDLLLIKKFVRRVKGSKCKILIGQIFEKAVKLWAYRFIKLRSIMIEAELRCWPPKLSKPENILQYDIHEH